MSPSPPNRRATWLHPRRIAGYTSLLLSLGVAGILGWGGNLIVAPDALPAHADVLVVLSGSLHGEHFRRQAAMRLLGQGRADRVVLSAPQVVYMGEWVPDLMRRYVDRVYGAELARRVVLCPHNADSTREEARALWPCLEARGWRSIVVITSNYHTRRAGRIWRQAVRDARPPSRIFVYGVSDGDFEPRDWWLNRRYAKTFLGETTKLVWTYLFERAG